MPRSCCSRRCSLCRAQRTCAQMAGAVVEAQDAQRKHLYERLPRSHGPLTRRATLLEAYKVHGHEQRCFDALTVSGV